MTKATIILTASTPEKFPQLIQLVEQAGRLAHVISQEKREAIADSQAWYWTKMWQAMEREADDALATGEYCEFDSTEALLADLNARG